MERVWNFDELCRDEEFTEDDVVKAKEVFSVFLWAARYLSSKYHKQYIFK